MQARVFDTKPIAGGKKEATIVFEGGISNKSVREKTGGCSVGFDVGDSGGITLSGSNNEMYNLARNIIQTLYKDQPLAMSVAIANLTKEVD